MLFIRIRIRIQAIFQFSILVSPPKLTRQAHSELFFQQVIYTHNTNILSVTKLFGNYKSFIFQLLVENT